MVNFVAIDAWSPRTNYRAINIICAGLLQIPNTDLGHSVYVLLKRLTGHWLEATL